LAYNGCSWRINEPDTPIQQPGMDANAVETLVQAAVSKDIVALRTEIQSALSTLRDDLASSKQEKASSTSKPLTTLATLRTEMDANKQHSAFQVQNTLVALRTEMDANKQYSALQVQGALTTLRKEMDNTVSTSIHDALTTLRAEFETDVSRVEQSLRSELAGTRAYPFQGDFVAKLESLHIDEPLTVETERRHVDLAEGNVIAFQLATSSIYLHVADADASTLPIDHLVWKPVDQPISELHECLFVVKDVEANTFCLRSAFSGDYLQLKKDKAVYAKGWLATLTEDVDSATRVTMTLEGSSIRLAGPKDQQLSCVTLNDYDILATRSILPIPQGLFILHKIQ
jgi:hypothetical protein